MLDHSDLKGCSTEVDFKRSADESLASDVFDTEVGICSDECDSETLADIFDKFEEVLMTLDDVHSKEDDGSWDCSRVR